MMKAVITVMVFAATVSGLFGLDAEEVLARAGDNRDEVSTFIAASREQGFGEWADFLLSSMEDVDLVNLNSKDFIEYFTVLKRNAERVSWGTKIDGFLFQHYVLPHRVSQEPLERFAAVYGDSLYELVRDTKDMREAVLRINEWTFTRMKYEPTARWDQNATTTIQRGFGRCEEMAILCIKAMRAVCIPARKVYSPWWPFTNSNHAWVEVWVDGKWHFLGGAEPTDLEHAWFNFPARRTAMVMGVVYGEIEPGNEVIYKKQKGYTVINSTANYADVTRLSIQVLQNAAPQESVSVSLCVYNYSSLVPVGIKKTDGDGFVSFTVGRTDLFAFASLDSLKDFQVWKASEKNHDTLVLHLTDRDVPDTSFWIYTKRIEKKEKKPEYEPNRDSLKTLQNLHIERITMVDTLLASIMEGNARKKLMIFYHAKGRAPALLAFYAHLQDELQETFIEFFDAIHPKDVVSIDTVGLSDELQAVKHSVASCAADVPDSILTRYLISGRILFEQVGFWRKPVLEEFKGFRKGTEIETAAGIIDWIGKHISKVERKGYFGPQKNPLDTYVSTRGTDGERYILAVGILRSLGIPARVLWSYDGLEFWAGSWRKLRFESPETEQDERWISLRFMDGDQDVTTQYRYYYDFSITRFDEHPERLDPPVDTVGGIMTVTLDDKPSYVITGWRNGFGDTYVRMKRFVPEEETLRIDVETGIPDDIRPGDLMVREYLPIDVKSVDLKNEEITEGKILFIVLDLDTEASKSTLLAARDALNGFEGKLFFFVNDPEREKGEDFVRSLGIDRGRILTVSKETYRKKWNMRNLPAILHLLDGECVFWTEGLFLHLTRLLDDFK